MLSFIGKSAHSAFRLKQLLDNLQAKCPDIKGVTSRYEYFVFCQHDLSEKDQKHVNEILSAKLAVEAPERKLTPIWVLPRMGTQSSWGAKARDILHNVDIQGIERIERAVAYHFETEDEPLENEEIQLILPILYDRMTESVIRSREDAKGLFESQTPQPGMTIPVTTSGSSALQAANQSLGLALSTDEIEYLTEAFQTLKRDPTDTELMMFAQANSEHCRHKIFKAQWTIDGKQQADSLFGMIKNTYEHNPKGVLSAYSDNASVISGFGKTRFYPTTENKIFDFHQEPTHILMKVETHNHPTAIEPFAGAGTGQGGEIRDEGAVGQGSKPKAGLSGFTVSHLHIPNYAQPWENESCYPERIANALSIMLKAPIGGAAFNNEFGRPNICGYFRSYEQGKMQDAGYQAWGYHKPVMIAGGMGNISENHIHKKDLPEGTLLIVLGGPAMKIGLGGGSASSVAAGASDAELDFASVQRQNPEMERRCQEVIDACCAMGKHNPILSIHDVGAGGLANALPELVHDCNKGAKLDIRKIPNAEQSMSPLEIWCNESQERYVLGILEKDLAQFTEIAQRERCPFAVLGTVQTEPQLEVIDPLLNDKAIDLPQSVLFGNAPKMHRDTMSKAPHKAPFDTESLSIKEAASRVLQHPTVADKSFLITIGDRTVTGLVAQDQMVGPWQIPVADCAVTATTYTQHTGEAMSMGERPPLARLDSKASAKMAVAEAVLNIVAADIENLSDIRLSCNWMAAPNAEHEDAALFAAVQAVGKEICPAWDITVPVGKDSLSMRTAWSDNTGSHSVTSPVTLVVSAFAPVSDVRKTLTPYCQTERPFQLCLIDLSNGKTRMGQSIYAEITDQSGGTAPNVDDPDVIKRFFKAFTTLKSQGKILAYHDRSDGGLFTTLCEMSFASHMGLAVDLAAYYQQTEASVTAMLFNEECGAVIQVAEEDMAHVSSAFKDADISLIPVAQGRDDQQIVISQDDGVCLQEERRFLQGLWSKTSYHMQALRDNPECAREAYAEIQNDNRGLFVKTTHELPNPSEKTYKGKRPRIAILREQGVNGQLEMAAAFTLAGFEAVDVTMSDLQAGKTLNTFQGLVACGGFSYGDVLGAGQGWAKSILFQPRLSDVFQAFFERDDTFSLGVCNGCQMLSHLKPLIPGAANWPKFIRNSSEQYEARVSNVEICRSPSILFEGMAGDILPIAVAHGEGHVLFDSEDKTSQEKPLLAMRFVNHQGFPTEHYPANPNGSELGMTGFTTLDGRATIMMPHPERVFKLWQWSWHPSHWDKDPLGYSPWMRLFMNARRWLD